MHRVLLIVTASLLATTDSGRAAPLEVKDGDIVFHTSRSRQSLAIQHATDSRYSHMGVVLFRDGRPYVYEAIATVRYTPLDRWIARGDRGHVVVKRLRDAAPLDAAGVSRLRKAAARYQGRPYDLTFEWSDERIYCSELVWKMYRDALGLEVGRQQRLGEFKLDHPAVRAKIQERYRGRPPLDEPVVTPQAMFESELLETIADR